MRSRDGAKRYRLVSCLTLAVESATLTLRPVRAHEFLIRTLQSLCVLSPDLLDVPHYANHCVTRFGC